MNRLGSTGMNLYYCTNYMSPIHADRDALRHSLCCQLEKKGCLNDELNFCYIRWGILLHTQRNTVWYEFLDILCQNSSTNEREHRMFRSEDEHCTEMPRRSSWERRRPQDPPAQPATTRSGRPSSSMPSSSLRVARTTPSTVSTGSHETLPLPAFKRARKMHQVRRKYEARAEWWNDYCSRSLYQMVNCSS